MPYLAAITALLAFFFLSIWLWAPLFLTWLTRRYNRRHPERATPRVWTRVDYMGFCSSWFWIGVLLLPVAAFLWERAS